MVSLEALLAASEASADESSEVPVLLFGCGDVVHGIEAERVRSIDEAAAIAPLPYPPRDVMGIATVRGCVCLVVRIGPSLPTGRGRLIALRDDRNVAIFADRVIGVVTAGRDVLNAPVESGDHTTLRSIDGQNVVMLDPATLVDS